MGIDKSQTWATTPKKQLKMQFRKFIIIAAILGLCLTAAMGKEPEGRRSRKGEPEGSIARNTNEPEGKSRKNLNEGERKSRKNLNEGEPKTKRNLNEGEGKSRK